MIQGHWTWTCCPSLSNDGLFISHVGLSVPLGVVSLIRVFLCSVPRIAGTAFPRWCSGPPLVIYALNLSKASHRLLPVQFLPLSNSCAPSRDRQPHCGWLLGATTQTDCVTMPMGHHGGLLLWQAVPLWSGKLVGTSLEGRKEGLGGLWEFCPHNTASTQMCVSPPGTWDLTRLKPVDHYRESELCPRKWRFPCVCSSQQLTLPLTHTKWSKNQCHWNFLHLGTTLLICLNPGYAFWLLYTY